MILLFHLLYCPVCMYVCMYVCIIVRIVPLHVFIYVCMLTCMHVYVCMYVGQQVISLLVRPNFSAKSLVNLESEERFKTLVFNSITTTFVFCKPYACMYVCMYVCMY
jgi:hypothetical protein